VVGEHDKFSFVLAIPRHDPTKDVRAVFPHIGTTELDQLTRLEWFSHRWLRIEPCPSSGHQSSTVFVPGGEEPVVVIASIHGNDGIR
jgi:hypothetical protein